MKQFEVNYKCQRMIRMEMRDKKNPTNLNLPKQFYPHQEQPLSSSPFLRFTGKRLGDLIDRKTPQRKVRALEGGNEALAAWGGVMEDYYPSRLVYRRRGRDFAVINILFTLTTNPTHRNHKTNDIIKLSYGTEIRKNGISILLKDRLGAKT